ncbi:hypothetical protein BASA50_002646 [Batrachochytrium salamandrivorans]|uniref:Magnesium transporter protein 1 n=1 Tax=Batrachochytrium salamandrivorans TaxID=1357716 RepID=A0ABQ8FL58_9FUNG|nr:hypothetical protein BASA50_002646 [Batrachochytrium salamandrivorans]
MQLSLSAVLQSAIAWSVLISPLMIMSSLGSSVNSRIEQLNALHQGVIPIPLDEVTYNLFTEKPRNYTMFIMLTTTVKEHNCQPCVQWHKQYKQVAEAWSSSFEAGKLYFAELDFSKGHAIFTKSVPLVLRFPPTEGNRAIKGVYELYDLNRHGFEIEPFLNHIETTTGIKIKIRKPVNYNGLIVGAVTAAAIGATLFVFQDQIIALLALKALWISLSLTITLIMCGGYMWNTIRAPPFIGNKDGQPHFLSGGLQYQFGVETHIVAILYGLASTAFVALVVMAPKVSTPAAQRTAVFICLVSFMFVYSVILSVFKLKAGNYPFRLMF